MLSKRPLILITNDDGYLSKGIDALIDSVKHLGDIVVVAPDGPRSGMSSAISCADPLRVNLYKEENNVKIYSCTGTPVDCVKLGISEVAGRKPDLLLSGINHGSNAAISVIYSGTMGAAMEGCVFKVPSIGFSLTDHSHDADFTEAKKITERISKQVLAEGLPVGTCLNVNIPNELPIKGVKICSQTPGQWIKEFVKSKDGQEKDVFWLAGEFANDTLDDQSSDEWALSNRYVTIVPTKVDMTDYANIPLFKKWEEDF